MDDALGLVEADFVDVAEDEGVAPGESETFGVGDLLMVGFDGREQPVNAMTTARAIAVLRIITPRRLQPARSQVCPLFPSKRQ